MFCARFSLIRIAMPQIHFACIHILLQRVYLQVAECIADKPNMGSRDSHAGDFCFSVFIFIYSISYMNLVKPFTYLAETLFF